MSQSGYQPNPLEVQHYELVKHKQGSALQNIRAKSYISLEKAKKRKEVEEASTIMRQTIKIYVYATTLIDSLATSVRMANFTPEIHKITFFFLQYTEVSGSLEQVCVFH